MKTFILEQLYKGVSTQVGEVDRELDGFWRSVEEERKVADRHYAPLYPRLNKDSVKLLCVLYVRLRKRRRSFNRVQVIEYILNNIVKHNIRGELTEKESKAIEVTLAMDFYLPTNMKIKNMFYQFTEIADYLKDVKPMAAIQMIKRYMKLFDIK